jgi:hypothetical protein
MVTFFKEDMMRRINLAIRLFALLEQQPDDFDGKDDDVLAAVRELWDLSEINEAAAEYEASCLMALVEEDEPMQHKLQLAIWQGWRREIQELTDRLAQAKQ